MDFNIIPAMEQKQTLSANQVLSLNILAYTAQELENFLINEYLENPMLENSGNKETEMLTNIETIYEKGKSYSDYYLENSNEFENRKGDIAARPPHELKSFLLGQLHPKEYTTRQWLCMGYLIDCLDSTGYFTLDLEDLSHTPIDKAGCFQTEELETALSCLKKLEPAGIFSKDLSECLILQLERKGIQDPVLFCLIRNHLEDLMNGRLSIISRNLKTTTAQLKKYIREISLLNPRPVLNSPSESPSYLIPDILVSKNHDSWDVTINDSWTGEYSYNDYYIRMMNETEDVQLKQYFKEKLERTRLILNSVEQRRQTLIQIVKFLLDYQYDYFENGGALKPLKQEQAADTLGIHISTVSRAIKGKYLQYKKTIPIKSLFSASVSSSDSTNTSFVSSQSVKEKIRQLIAQEQDPLSDQKLSELLAESHIHISRRGVTKYRIELGIADSRHRKLMK